MKRRGGYHVYALLTVVLWSTSYVFTRLALPYFSAFSLGFLRYAAASCALLAPMLARRFGRPPRAALPRLILSGACGFFLYMIAFNKGSETVTAATSCTVIAAAPVITAVLARGVFGERLSVLRCAAIAIAFGGVVLLMFLNLRLDAGPGLLYILAAAILLSVYNLLQRRLTQLCPPLQATSWSIFFGTLMLGIFAPGAVRELAAAPAAPIAYVLILGVLCGAVAYVSWTKALSLADNTAAVSNYMFIEPFLTAVLGLLLAGERVTASTAAGGAVILAGLFLYYFGDGLLRAARHRP